MTNEKRLSINSQRLVGLYQKLQNAITASFKELEALGYLPYIVQGLRTQAQQDAYYAQGREDLETVNVLRKKAGLDPIGEDENSKKVTWIRHSKHNDGAAVDIVNVMANGDINWDDMKFYKAAAEIFSKYGVTWGGTWKTTPDYPHFEV